MVDKKLTIKIKNPNQQIMLQWVLRTQWFHFLVGNKTKAMDFAFVVVSTTNIYILGQFEQSV